MPCPLLRAGGLRQGGYRMNSTSYNVGGGAVGGAHAMAVSTSSTRRTASSRKSQQKKTPKKHVNYNPREIRSALMRATKSQSAGQVLCQARSKLANLAKCKGTGMYNESEQIGRASCRERV